MTHPDTETSMYLDRPDDALKMSLNTHKLDSFSNISVVYKSTVNPTVIYTATRYGKLYVLKGISPEMANDPVLSLGLLKEFNIGITLEHPNVRRTIGYEDVEGPGKVIVLEYFDGITLDEYLRTRPLSTKMARNIAKQIASALQYVHSHQVIHRDIKPANILVSHDGLYVKVIDFNFSDSGDYTILKNNAGSQRYLAPELMNPDIKASALTDIYSLGVILNDLAVAAHDSELMSVASKCCHADPERRPKSVENIVFPDPDATSFAQKLDNTLLSETYTYVVGAVCIVLGILIYLI